MRLILILQGIILSFSLAAQYSSRYDTLSRSYLRYDSTGRVEREQYENFIGYKATTTAYYPGGTKIFEYTTDLKERVEFRDTFSVTIFVDTFYEWSTTGKIKYMEIYTDSGRLELKFDTNSNVLISRGEFVNENYDTTIFIHYDENHGIKSDWCRSGCTYPIGSWITFHENGKIESEGNYLPYAMQDWKSFQAEDPQNPGLFIAVMLVWETKIRDGIWYYYDETGKEIREEFYEGGLLRRTIEY